MLSYTEEIVYKRFRFYDHIIIIVIIILCAYIIFVDWKFASQEWTIFFFLIPDHGFAPVTHITSSSLFPSKVQKTDVRYYSIRSRTALHYWTWPTVLIFMGCTAAASVRAIITTETCAYTYYNNNMLYTCLYLFAYRVWRALLCSLAGSLFHCKKVSGSIYV